MPTAYVREPAREIPVAAEVDVAVIGGGLAGTVAAIAAARGGASTLLVERHGYPGGIATAGLMTSFNGFRNEHPPNELQTVRGMGQEIVDRLLALDGATGCTAHGRFPLEAESCPYAVSFDPNTLTLVLLAMMDEAGVAPWFHTWFSDALARDGEIEAVLVESKSGRQAIRAKLFVDATGDADVCARAGARCDLAAPDGERMMAVTLMYRVMGLPEPGPDERRLWCNDLTTRWGPSATGVDGSDAGDLSRAEVALRRQVRDHVASLRDAFPQTQLVQIAAMLGVRETRRIVGLETITEEDVLTGRPRETSISVSSNPIPTYYGQRRFLEHLGFEVPYGSLVPADLRNALAAGRCISASQPAFQSARSMAPLMAHAQATGTAAALCVQARVSPHDLDVPTLQGRLERDGAVTRIPDSYRS